MVHVRITVHDSEGRIIYQTTAPMPQPVNEPQRRQADTDADPLDLPDDLKALIERTNTMLTDR